MRLPSVGRVTTHPLIWPRESGPLSLRPPTDADIEQALTWRNSPEVTRWLLLTTVDPIMVTEYSVVFSAIALPLTYVPILIVANDRTYMGERVNGRLANLCGTVVLVPVLVASAAAIPLMIITRVGQ